MYHTQNSQYSYIYTCKDKYKGTENINTKSEYFCLLY